MLKPVYIKNYFTEDIIYCDDIVRAALFLNVSRTTMYNYLNYRKGEVIEFFYSVSYKHDFKEIQDPLYAYNKETRKQTYVLVDKWTGDVFHFDSIVRIALLLNVGATTINNYIRGKTEHKFFSIYYYKKYKDENPLLDWRKAAMKINKQKILDY